MTDKQFDTIMTILMYAAAILLGFFLGVVADQKIQRIETVECQEWKHMSQLNWGFRYMGWQEEQCERYNLLPKEYDTYKRGN